MIDLQTSFKSFLHSNTHRGKARLKLSKQWWRRIASQNSTFPLKIRPSFINHSGDRPPARRLPNLPPPGWEDDLGDSTFPHIAKDADGKIKLKYTIITQDFLHRGHWGHPAKYEAPFLRYIFQSLFSHNKFRWTRTYVANDATSPHTKMRQFFFQCWGKA